MKPQVGLSEVSQDMNFVRFGLSYICGLPLSFTFDLPCWWFRCTCIHLTWFIFSHLLPCYWFPCPALVQLESHIHVLVSPWATLSAIHHFTTIILLYASDFLRWWWWNSEVTVGETFATILLMKTWTWTSCNSHWLTCQMNSDLLCIYFSWQMHQWYNKW